MSQYICSYEETYGHRLDLITRNYAKPSIIGDNIIWKSPLYKFVIPDGLDKTGTPLYKELYIDVTDSAPRFETS